MYDKKRNHKKIKKRRSFRAVFLTALICAAVSVLVIVGALWFVGLRYVSLNTADGTKIKFFGMVDSDGTPMRGKIVYSIGLVADVDRDRDTISYSDAEIFVTMTQDAMPADRYLIERLTENLYDSVAVAYARQLPASDCRETERISRYFNYPAKSRIKTADDIGTLGIKTFFCSNVCAAYRRDIYEELGGFIRHTIFNEDMIYAAGAVRAGYGIAYEADARVIHSHNYTNMQQLRRNFDLGVSQADHPEIFAGVPSEAEGKKLVQETYRYLKRKKKRYLFPGFCVQCGFKYAGYIMGKNYRKLPRRWVMKITMNREYWK